MATEALAPDALLTQTNLNGALSNVSLDDTTWLTAASNNANSVLIVSFPTPTGDPTVGAGVQSCEVKYRVTANARSVSFDAYILESGVRLNGGVAVSSWSGTNTGELTQTVAWNANLLGVADGSAFELEVVAIKSGGSPANRTAGEFQFVEWNADYTIAAPNINGTASTSQASTISATIAKIASGLLITTAATATTGAGDKQAIFNPVTSAISSAVSAGLKAVNGQGITNQGHSTAATGTQSVAAPDINGTANTTNSTSTSATSTKATDSNITNSATSSTSGSAFKNAIESATTNQGQILNGTSSKATSGAAITNQVSTTAATGTKAEPAPNVNGTLTTNQVSVTALTGLKSVGGSLSITQGQTTSATGEQSSSGTGNNTTTISTAANGTKNANINGSVISLVATNATVEKATSGAALVEVNHSLSIKTPASLVAKSGFRRRYGSVIRTVFG